MNHKTLLGAVLLAVGLVAGSGAARAGGTVVVYTAHIQSIIDALVPQFEKDTGIHVDVVKAGSGEILKRVKAESGAPRADVIWSVGGEELEANSDLLQSYTPKDADKIDPKFQGGKNWLPYSGIVNVLIVNTKKVAKGEEPKSWMDLTDPKWKGRISMARADTSGSAYMQLATVLTIYGNDQKGWDVYSKILGNTTLSESSGAVPRFVNDGEQAVGVTLEDNALNYVRNGGPVTIVYPSDGTSVAADGIALVKGAPDAENGKAFIDWCLAKPSQEYLVNTIGRRSVRTDVAAGKGVPPLSDVKTIDYSTQWAGAHRAELVKHWTELVHQR